MAIAVPREITDGYGGLLAPGQTLDDALEAIQHRDDYLVVLGTPDAQRLLEDAARMPGARRAAVAREVRHLTDRGMDIEAAQLARDTGLACVGSNHLPDCEHFASSKNLQPLERLPAQLVEIPLEAIDVGSNVRTEPGELELLASSIRDHGVIQPVKAVEIAPGRYRLVWGQRRVLASKLAGRTTIPAVVEMEPDPTLSEPGARRSIEQLIENIQRADLNDLDEAKALREVLAADPKLSQAELARRLGRDPSWVSNTLVVLDVAEPVQQLVAAGDLTGAHVKALRGLAPKTQAEIARAAAKDHASARTVEGMVQQHKRNEQWRKEGEARSRRDAEAHKTARTAALANFAKKKVPLDAPIRLLQGTKPTVEAITALGYTDVKIVGWYDVRPRPKAAACDCTAWKVEEKYGGGLAISPGCTNSKHREAQRTADDFKAASLRKLAEDVRKRLEEVLPAELTAQPAPRLLLRVALWHALDYNAADWAEKRGGKRNKPWDAIEGLSDAELVQEAGRALAKTFRDRYGYHLPWERLATELGLDAG